MKEYTYLSFKGEFKKDSLFRLREIGMMMEEFDPTRNEWDYVKWAVSIKDLIRRGDLISLDFNDDVQFDDSRLGVEWKKIKAAKSKLGVEIL